MKGPLGGSDLTQVVHDLDSAVRWDRESSEKGDVCAVEEALGRVVFGAKLVHILIVGVVLPHRCHCEIGLCHEVG